MDLHDQLNNTYDKDPSAQVEAIDASTLKYDLTGVANNRGTPRTRLEIIQDLTKTLPKNDFGMPAFIYRADFIPEAFDELTGLERDHILHEATQPITYAEGFPALGDGTPIWGPLAFEAPEAYHAFQAYMDLADTEGVRRVDILNQLTLPSTPRQTLIEYHIYYYWSLRARAHDLYQIAAAQKMRERRILRTNNTHFLEAEKLLGKVLGYFSKTDEDGNLIWMTDLTPKVAMDMFDKLTKIQRVSLGLPAHGSASGEETDTPRNANMELILRTVAQKSGDVGQKSSQNVMDMLLNQPEMAEMAQELILRANNGGKERKIKEIADSSMSIAEELGGS